MTHGPRYSTPRASRWPALGPRGEGWVILQAVGLGGAGLAGMLGPAWDGPARIVSSVVGAALIGAGAVLALAAARALGAALTPLPRPGTDAVLVQSGPFRLARHPIYGGLVSAATGWGLVTASVGAIVVAAGLLAFFDAKSRREEAWLEEQFPEYPAYRARTRRLLPWIY